MKVYVCYMWTNYASDRKEVKYIFHNKEDAEAWVERRPNCTFFEEMETVE